MLLDWPLAVSLPYIIILRMAKNGSTGDSYTMFH